MRRISFITLLFVILTCNLSIAQTKNSIILPDGAAIKLTLMQRLDSGDKGLKVGDTIKLQATNDIVEDGNVILKKHAEAVGTLTKKQHSGPWNHKGKIDFQIDWVIAVDGTKIPLRSSLYATRKSHKVGMVAEKKLISPIKLYLNGKNAVVKKGTIFTAYVNSDTPISF